MRGHGGSLPTPCHSAETEVHGGRCLGSRKRGGRFWKRGEDIFNLQLKSVHTACCRRWGLWAAGDGVRGWIACAILPSGCHAPPFASFCSACPPQAPLVRCTRTRRPSRLRTRAERSSRSGGTLRRRPGMRDPGGDGIFCPGPLPWTPARLSARRLGARVVLSRRRPRPR